MSYTLDNRDKLRRAFWRLLNTTSDDDALIEQNSETNESVHYFLMHGLWNAQAWMILHVDPSRWVTTTAAITWVTPSAPDVGYYVALAADFLMLAGSDDEKFSPLRDASGNLWGKLIDWKDRFQYKNSNVFWLQNERLYRGAGSTPPTTLYLDYHQRHATLTDDTGAGSGGLIDFPLQYRPLIVAEAAMVAQAEGWLTGGAEQTTKLVANLGFWRDQATAGTRRSHTPPRTRAKKPLNPNRFIY